MDWAPRTVHGKQMVGSCAKSSARFSNKLLVLLVDNLDVRKYPYDQ